VRLSLVTLALTAVLAASCSGGDDGSSSEAGPLTIFASTSLQGVFDELAPDADIRYDSSDVLADAVRDGDVPDVFASADPAVIAELQPEAVLDPPAVFATNRVVVVVPQDGPSSLQELAGVEPLLGVEPEYARSTLEAVGLGDLLQDVPYDPAAVEQVAAGEADAAVAYFSDAQAAGDGVRVLELPAQALAQNAVSIYNASPRYGEAEAFVELLLGEEGRAALEAAGFSVPAE
jgi:molybdate transport system substrate-binding protein